MIVDNNICLHCGACVGTCPSNAIFLYETSTIVFLPACSGCGLCAIVCPVGAIDEGPGEPSSCGGCSQAKRGRTCIEANN